MSVLAKIEITIASYDTFLRAEEGPVLQEIKGSGFCKPGQKREWLLGRRGAVVVVGRNQEGWQINAEVATWKVQIGTSCHGYWGSERAGNEDQKHKMSKQSFNGGKTRSVDSAKFKPKPVAFPKLEQGPRVHVRDQMERREFC